MRRLQMNQVLVFLSGSATRSTVRVPCAERRCEDAELQREAAALGAQQTLRPRYPAPS